MHLSLLFWLSMLVGQTPAPATPDTKDPPTVAQKEETPKVMVSLANRILMFLGTPLNDKIEVNVEGENLVISGQSFPVGDVDQIVIDGGLGDDELTVPESWKGKSTLYGSGGDDALLGGGGDDKIYGGWGDDRISGREGDDLLVGGLGRDRMDGGSGKNTSQQENIPVTRKSDNSAAEKDILRLVNHERITFVPQPGVPENAEDDKLAEPKAASSESTKPKLSELVVDAQLNQAASWHAENMAARSTQDGYEVGHSHTLDGVTMPTMTSRLDSSGYGYSSVRENIAFGYPNPEAVVTGWMNSPGHKANILADDVSEVGIAVATDKEGRPFYCMVFAAPIPAQNPQAGFRPLRGAQ